MAEKLGISVGYFMRGIVSEDLGDDKDAQHMEDNAGEMKLDYEDDDM